MAFELTAPVPGTNPVLLLDIDGVFNVFADKNLPPEYVAHSQPIFRYNPAHGPAITELTEQAFPIYISDWQENSHAMAGAAHSWPRFNWIDSFKYGTNQDNRRRAAADFLLANHPMAWIDDELNEADFNWAEQRTTDGTPTLLIKPDSRTGLVEKELTTVKQWLGQLATAR